MHRTNGLLLDYWVTNYWANGLELVGLGLGSTLAGHT